MLKEVIMKSERILNIISRIFRKLKLTKLEIITNSIVHKNYIMYLENKYGDIIRDYQKIPDKPTQSQVAPQRKIWLYWRQGFNESTPEIVSAVAHQLQKYNNNENIVLLDNNSIKNWIEIPDYLPEMVKTGKVSFAHEADIIRMRLLSKYGGIWVDATNYFVREMPSEYFEKNFISVQSGKNENKRSVVDEKWMPFFLGGKANNTTFDFVSLLLEKSIQDEKEVLTYFLMDYIFALAYKYNIGNFKNDVDEIGGENSRWWKYRDNLNKVISDNEWEIFLNDPQVFYKITYKLDYIHELNGELTFYGRLMKKTYET